ncbi:MAG TPA: hypothetical protein VMF90_11995 [Rhizobiaceae bacterium]|nr:hypothetical protein [Rhizobiaceae bacterium]
MAEYAAQPAGEAVPEPDADLEAACDEAIRVCGGDMRAAIVSLILANTFLKRELALTRPAVSYGFSRGWHRNR